MNGELRCSRTERVRTDAGRVAIAAAALTLALAPAAAANGKGNGNGNSNAGSPPAHAGQQGPPPHANNDNGNRSPSSQGNGSRGNSGNAPGRSHGNPTPGTRPSQAPPSWSNAGGRRPSSTPAPRGGNDTPKKSEHDNNGAAHQKTTICHATGSDTNPYVEITISDRALKAHAAHQDGRDIIPAPGGGCPKAEVTNATTDAIAGLGPAFDAALPGPPTVAGATASGSSEPTGETTGRPVAAGDVAGAEATGETPAAGAAADTAAASNSPDKGEEGGSLPFTGLAVVMLAIAGALLIATGLGLKRSHATRT